MGSPMRLAVVGAGHRGTDVYGAWCLDHPGDAAVVAVAEPDASRRDRLADRHGIPAGGRHGGWRELLGATPGLDGVVVATPDRCHVGPAAAALASGLDVLVEKPISPTREGIARMLAAARESDATVTVAHVLRYTPFFRAVRRILDAGDIGELVSIAHTEHIGYWHFAHSYVRGNWRRAEAASPMILAKACHDLDLLRWFAGAPCERVASFGQLRHFRRDRAPAGAPPYCLDGCPVEEVCAFHASRFYVDALAGWRGPPVTIVSPDPAPGAVLEALRDGPYGRCVYRCDNDVPDHQVVACAFAGGVTATLQVSAFTEDETRTVHLMGTEGELTGDLGRGRVEVRRFLPAPAVARPTGAPGAGQARGAATSATRWTVEVGERAALEDALEAPAGAFVGHAGGDAELMRDFVRRARLRRSGGARTEALTSLEQSLDSHAMAFAAEHARRTRTVVDLDDPEWKEGP